MRGAHNAQTSANDVVGGRRIARRVAILNDWIGSQRNLVTSDVLPSRRRWPGAPDRHQLLLIACQADHDRLNLAQARVVRCPF